MLHVILWTRYTIHYSMCAQLLSRIRLFATPWTIIHQAPLSMGFSRKEYWSGLLWPPPGGLPDPRMEPRSLMSLALAGGFSILASPWKPLIPSPGNLNFGYNCPALLIFFQLGISCIPGQNCEILVYGTQVKYPTFLIFRVAVHFLLCLINLFCFLIRYTDIWLFKNCDDQTGLPSPSIHPS